MKKLAFYRDFSRFTGGHLKVWDYYRHTRESHAFKPAIYFTVNSTFDASNPWIVNGESRETDWTPEASDALFLGGMDWLAVPEECGTPVLNLIQGVRHAYPSDPRHQFLSRRAIRICVSKEVELAILATGKVNGPTITIGAGLDLDALPRPAEKRDIPLLIAGFKQPTLAKQLSSKLAALGIANLCQTIQLPRQEFLGLLGRASVTVFLPHAKEGFYLPALEGMAMGTLVVCPDCVGNREFCISNTNCLMPDYTSEGLLAACLAAVTSGKHVGGSLRSNGLNKAKDHALEIERHSYLAVLQQVATA